MKIHLRPVETIVIHDLIKYPLDLFVKMQRNKSLSSGRIAVAWWCDGYMFEYGYINPIDPVVKDQIDGILHWAYCIYTEYPTYKEKIEFEHGGTFIVQDMSEDEMFKEVVKFVKDHH